MATQDPNIPIATTVPTIAPTAPDDLPPPYSAVVGNPPYGFVVPTGAYPAGSQFPKSFTAPGVYPHPPAVNITQPQAGDMPSPAGMSVPVGVVIPAAVGSEPTTVTCYNCGKVVTTRVTYTTAWHTHLVAGSVCIITMACSLCCLGLVPYCFDTFKDAEHYCPNCSTFIGKSNKC
ncbi:lipopolysaccharide-induced tumor necrosis factor-alpha factor homolog [Zerene cesonia]|uniref:lipopolysaccharide-induced tumor necrosis factor-alpha factor homolog n=1 Tax=Zerene cesonia TaxID=33412 RepID=UPI0018E553E0|nr:lipopolysaccharide-induced tumor necrosis factor-alpha factor homolog [Zerene cesonia]XP_038206814.1 lipopolysaccharide-induced tumor necrosis factor-alpha factor homolog [Zerene cesonia]